MARTKKQVVEALWNDLVSTVDLDLPDYESYFFESLSSGEQIKIYKAFDAYSEMMHRQSRPESPMNAPVPNDTESSTSTMTETMVDRFRLIEAFQIRISEIEEVFDADLAVVTSMPSTDEEYTAATLNHLQARISLITNNQVRWKEDSWEILDKTITTLPFAPVRITHENKKKRIEELVAAKNQWLYPLRNALSLLEMSRDDAIRVTTAEFSRMLASPLPKRVYP